MVGHSYILCVFLASVCVCLGVCACVVFFSSFSISHNKQFFAIKTYSTL
jgi:hypothetical protein